MQSTWESDKKRNRFLRILFTSLVACTGSIVLFSLLSNSVASSTSNSGSYLTAFPLQLSGSPRNLIRHGQDLWFTAPGANAIGRLVVTSTANYSFDFYPIPTSDSHPYDLVAKDGMIWFTERDGNKIGRLDIDDGTIMEYAVPTSDSAPAGIDIDANGDVWFVEQLGDKLGEFHPGTGSFTETTYSPPSLPNAPRPYLEDIAVDSRNDVVWFTAAGSKLLVRYDVGNREFYGVPSSGPGIPLYTPSQVRLDSQGNPWVSTHDGHIGRFSPSTLQYFRWYRAADSSSAIDGLFWRATASGNQLWFTESNTGYVGQLSTSAGGSTQSNWRFPIIGASPQGIVTDNDGTVWLADSSTNVIWRWTPPYYWSTYLPAIFE